MNSLDVFYLTKYLRDTGLDICCTDEFLAQFATIALLDDWLAAWYLSQIQAANPQPPAKTRKAPEIPAQQPEPAIQSQYVMPEYSGKSLF